MIFEVTFPWPAKELNPNNNFHWSKVAKYKQKARIAAWGLAREMGATSKTFAPDCRINLDIFFYPPDKRIRDQDNMIASMKSTLDGLADALVINDFRFNVRIKVMQEVRGLVKIALSEESKLKESLA
jgi:Holliday junction resolvase RusA-like endonuclease